MPDAPWIMTQTWNDLLFAHWPVDRRLLQEQVPAGLSLDLFEGQAWIGIVPFRITNLAPRGVPSIPFVSAFAELNVRTYVTLEHKRDDERLFEVRVRSNGKATLRDLLARLGSLAAA